MLHYPASLERIVPLPMRRQLELLQTVNYAKSLNQQTSDFYPVQSFRKTIDVSLSYNLLLNAFEKTMATVGL